MGEGENKIRGSNAADGVDRGCSEETKAATPFTEDWSVERHDHDDGVISYEIWGHLRGEYSFLFHIYEQPFVDEAQQLANFLVRAVNCRAELLEALKDVGQKLEARLGITHGSNYSMADEVAAIKAARAAIAKAAQPPAKAGEAKQ